MMNTANLRPATHTRVLAVADRLYQSTTYTLNLVHCMHVSLLSRTGRAAAAIHSAQCARHLDGSSSRDLMLCRGRIVTPCQ